MKQETFWIEPRPPYRLGLTVWALRRKARNLIDQWDGTTYTRILSLDGQIVKVQVSQPSPQVQPRLLVTATSERPLVHIQDRVSNVLQRVLGYTRDMATFSDIASHDPQLSPLARRFLGVKPPRFPSVFEALLNAFACQQVSLDVGILLLNRLTEAYGLPWQDEHGRVAAFPGPEQLAGASIEELRALGWSRQKARATLELADSLVQEPQKFAHLEAMNNEEVYQTLLPLRGVGRWSTEYIMLRGLGRIDVFPGDDVGAQKKLQTLFSLAEPLTYGRIKELTSRWQPYAGFVYFHLLLQNLDKKGLLPP